MADEKFVKKLLEKEILELIEKKDWHNLKEAIIEWPAPDIAELIEEMKEEYRIIIFRLLPKKLSAEVFDELNSITKENLLSQLTDEHIKNILSELPPDERTDLFEELPGKVTQKLLNLLPIPERKEALQLLGYPANSVGRLMTPDYVAIKKHWTIEKSLQHIREFGKNAETINVVYVVDNDWKLLDDIPLSKLILAEPYEIIERIMDYHFIAIEVHKDQEEAANLMRKYDLIVLPVIDEDGTLLGIVTVDDVLNVVEQEHTKDMTKIFAITPETAGIELITDLLKTPVKNLYKSRVTWLIFLLFMDFFTGGIIQRFNEIIARYVVLVTFLPVLVDTAGNAGAQSATLIIRSMALGKIKMKDWFKMLGKEIFVALLLGLTMGLGISFMGIVRGGFRICKVVVISMVLNVITGCLMGMALPFIFTKFKKDPATASAPLITTLADILGTAIYFSVAMLLLK
ncbi:MAG: magnesium transporter [Candidatus Omnitrophica bacterium]|nr:magnesium transporter [Candidatus Omnitrophota bacterium]MCM8806467.1 magnesium transporter [Candidatus Omnitrophota bacterium]